MSKTNHEHIFVKIMNKYQQRGKGSVLVQAEWCSVCGYIQIVHVGKDNSRTVVKIFEI